MRKMSAMVDYDAIFRGCCVTSTIITITLIMNKVSTIVPKISVNKEHLPHKQQQKKKFKK